MMNFNMDIIDYTKIHPLSAPEQPHIKLCTKFGIDMWNIEGDFVYERMYNFPGISDQRCWTSIVIYHVIFEI